VYWRTACGVVRWLFGSSMDGSLVALFVSSFVSFLAMPGLCCFLRYASHPVEVSMPGSGWIRYVIVHTYTYVCPLLGWSLSWFLGVAGLLLSSPCSTWVHSHPLWCRISNTDDWPNFSKLPLVGMITTNDDARSVAVLSQHPEDNRGGGSYFATTTEDTETVLVFDVEDDGLLLQVVHNSVNASPPGLCASATAARLLQPCYTWPEVIPPVACAGSRRDRSYSTTQQHGCCWLCMHEQATQHWMLRRKPAPCPHAPVLSSLGTEA